MTGIFFKLLRKTGLKMYKHSLFYIFFFLIIYDLAAQKPDSVLDMLYEYRIEKLAKKSPVPFEYNQHVKHYINIFTIDRRNEFSKITGLAELYFPYFDQALDKYKLPLELKYLTIVESGLNPFAESKSGAVGLWQFLFNSCKMFDLEVNSYIDERRDVYKSTEAACKYLNYLYSIFNDWYLVLSSYNSGPGDVRKAIERANGSTDYWTIRPYLSEQAQRYVPAFIAAAYVLNYYKEHEIIPIKPSHSYNDLDTIKIGYSVSFQQISKMINYSVDSIRYFNPVYKMDFIPETDNQETIILPSEKILEFIREESKILGNINNKDDYHSILKKSNDKTDKIKIIHTVEKGEFFHKIAMKYSCSPENIKTWNNLEDSVLYPGQKLVIWVDEDVYQK